MNASYNIECPICDIITTVHVHYDEEEPRHCPMCGVDIVCTPTEEYDED